VTLASPVDALKQIAVDVTLKTTTKTRGGGAVSAMEIQRHYLQLAQKHATATWMPSWALRFVAAWQEILDRLEHGPEAVATCLDWAIKHQTFEAHLRRCGFTWESLDHWTHLVGLLAKGLASMKRPRGEVRSLTSAYVRSPACPIRDMVEQLDPFLTQRNLNWDQLDAYLKVRAELFEIDTRFGQLGEDGIFNRLDRAGLLDHRVQGIDDIQHAMEHPPAGGRAATRGAAIRQLAGERSRYSCDWEMIYDATEGRTMDLSDPWALSGTWAKGEPYEIAEREEYRALGELIRHCRRGIRPTPRAPRPTPPAAEV
jgi:hypothetical protein